MMTDTSFAAADAFDQHHDASRNARASAFNPVSIVAISAGLWATASATFLWAGWSWGWALGLGYLASPFLTIGVIFAACLLSDLGSARARRGATGFDRLGRDIAKARAVAAWDADCAEERAAAHRASDHAA